MPRHFFFTFKTMKDMLIVKPTITEDESENEVMENTDGVGRAWSKIT